MSTLDRVKLLREILPLVIKKCSANTTTNEEEAGKVAGQVELATEILYALNRGDFVNLLITAGLPPDYARKHEKGILEVGITENGKQETTEVSTGKSSDAS